MKKLLTSSWFWLILIFLEILVLDVTKIWGVDLLGTEIFWVALASICSLVSVIVVATTYCRDTQTKRRQATYDAYNQFKKDAFDQENEICDYDEDTLANILKSKKEADRGKKRSKENQSPNEWKKIKKYLANVERIATCVNNGIFDAETIYNMGGPFMIKMYKKLSPIIMYKREQEKSNGVYEEFEKMVRQLEKIHFMREK